MNIVWLFLGWPNGEVWGNLVADAITIPVAFVWAHRRAASKFTARVEELLDTHHQALTQQVDRALGAPGPEGGETPYGQADV